MSHTSFLTLPPPIIIRQTGRQTNPRNRSQIERQKITFSIKPLPGGPKYFSVIVRSKLVMSLSHYLAIFD